MPPEKNTEGKREREKERERERERARQRQTAIATEKGRRDPNSPDKKSAFGNQSQNRNNSVIVLFIWDNLIALRRRRPCSGTVGTQTQWQVSGRVLTYGSSNLPESLCLLKLHRGHGMLHIRFPSSLHSGSRAPVGGRVSASVAQQIKLQPRTSAGN